MGGGDTCAEMLGGVVVVVGPGVTGGVTGAPPAGGAGAAGGGIAGTAERFAGAAGVVAAGGVVAAVDVDGAEVPGSGAMPGAADQRVVGAGTCADAVADGPDPRGIAGAMPGRAGVAAGGVVPGS